MLAGQGTCHIYAHRSQMYKSGPKGFALPASNLHRSVCLLQLAMGLWSSGRIVIAIAEVTFVVNVMSQLY